jgi:cytochrome d ubiquinol oxidase subunit I
LPFSKGCGSSTKKPVFKNLYLFWVKIFALSFGMGVVSGVVMSYQFGTNWSVFSTHHRQRHRAAAGV